MKVKSYANFEKMSQAAADLFYAEIKKKPDALMCIATGSTPTLAYDLLAQKYSQDKNVFSKLRIIKLDEWGGLPSDDPATCETFIQEHLIKPLHITKKKYISFQSNPANPEKEIIRISKELEKQGPIDICVLGIGVNGHLGFNEPDDFLYSHEHIAHLAKTTKQHSMAKKAEHPIKYGLTLGLADIMASKKIILLVNGKTKKKIFRKLMSQKITSSVPASMLWMHPNVVCYCDDEVL